MDEYFLFSESKLVLSLQTISEKLQGKTAFSAKILNEPREVGYGEHMSTYAEQGIHDLILTNDL